MLFWTLGAMSQFRNADSQKNLIVLNFILKQHTSINESLLKLLFESIQVLSAKLLMALKTLETA